MSKEEIALFERRMAQIAQMAQLVKILTGCLLACVTAIGYAFVWVNQTTTGLASTKQELREIVDSRKETLKQWEAWKSSKDEIDTRLTTILENQQHMLDRLDRKQY